MSGGVAFRLQVNNVWEKVVFARAICERNSVLQIVFFSQKYLVWKKIYKMRQTTDVVNLIFGGRTLVSSTVQMQTGSLTFIKRWNVTLLFSSSKA